MFCKRNVPGSVPVIIHEERLFEVSMANVQMNSSVRSGSERLVDHMTGLEILMYAYPELRHVWTRRIQIAATSDMEASAHFRVCPDHAQIWVSTREADERNSFIHEIQHAIQFFDKRVGGSNPHYCHSIMMKKMLKTQDFYIKSVSSMMKLDANDPLKYILASANVRLAEALDMYSDDYAAFKYYSANQGEIEARLSEVRSYLKVEELASTPYVRDYDERYFNEDVA